VAADQARVPVHTSQVAQRGLPRPSLVNPHMGRSFAERSDRVAAFHEADKLLQHEMVAMLSEDCAKRPRTQLDSEAMEQARRLLRAEVAKCNQHHRLVVADSSATGSLWFDSLFFPP